MIWSVALNRWKKLQKVSALISPNISCSVGTRAGSITFTQGHLDLNANQGDQYLRRFLLNNSEDGKARY